MMLGLKLEMFVSCNELAVTTVPLNIDEMSSALIATGLKSHFIFNTLSIS
jgi:hypothetical protein